MKRLPNLQSALTTIAVLLFAQVSSVESAQSQSLGMRAKATTIYLVRHAEKAGATGDVELSETGHKRAACLATTLADARLQAIYTTEYKRTRATAVPTAARTGVTATVIGGADMDKLVAALQKAEGHNVLVVGHSNTVPKIIEKLGVGTVTIKDEEYDRLFVVTLINGQASLASLRYCP